MSINIKEKIYHYSKPSNIIKKIDSYIRPNNIKFGKSYFLFFLFFPRILKLRLFRNYIKIKKINYLKFLISEKKKEEIRFIFYHNNIDGSLDSCSKILKDNGIVIIENAFQYNTIKKDTLLRYADRRRKKSFVKERILKNENE